MPEPPNQTTATLLIHNPGCSKSRATRLLLEEKGIDFEVRAYLDDPLTRDELETLRRRLGRPVSQWVRPKEACFAKAGLSADSTDDELLDAIAIHPKLLERPIVVHGERAEIGRPPEQVLSLF